MSQGRLFELLCLLLERGRMTAPQLAEHFEVSVRTMMPRLPACRRRGLDSTVSMTRPSTVWSGDTASRTCRPCPGWRRSSSIRRGRSEGREAACSNTPGIRRSAVISAASSGPAGRMV